MTKQTLYHPKPLEDKTRALFTLKMVHTFWFLGLDDGISFTGFSIADLVLGRDGEVVSRPLFQTGDLVDSVVRLDVLHLDPLFAGLLTLFHTVASDLGSTILGRWLPFQGDIVWPNAGCFQVLRRSWWG